MIRLTQEQVNMIVVMTFKNGGFPKFYGPFDTLGDAKVWGEFWQKTEDDNPCWQVIDQVKEVSFQIFPYLRPVK